MLIGAGGGTPLIQGLTGSRQRVVVSDTDIDPAHAAFYVAGKTVPLGSVDSGAHPKLHGILNIPGYTNFGSNNGSHGQMTASLLAGYAWADGVQSGLAPGAASSLHRPEPRRARDHPHPLHLFRYP
jgi:subtilisin family serine protease